MTFGSATESAHVSVFCRSEAMSRLRKCSQESAFALPHATQTVNKEKEFNRQPDLNSSEAPLGSDKILLLVDLHKHRCNDFFDFFFFKGHALPSLSKTECFKPERWLD